MPHVGLPDMSVSFQVRKRTTQPDAPSPTRPAGSEVSNSATQSPNIVFAERSRVKALLPNRILAHGISCVIHNCQSDLLGTFLDVASQSHVNMIGHPCSNRQLITMLCCRSNESSIEPFEIGFIPKSSTISNNQNNMQVVPISTAIRFARLIQRNALSNDCKPLEHRSKSTIHELLFIDLLSNVAFDVSGMIVAN
jgi:hypothetical protein